MAIPQQMTLELVTPERSVLHEQVDEVLVPGSEGSLGIRPGHAPLLATLQVGQMWYRKGHEKTYLAVAFGFVEVLPDRVTVLAQIAERADEIDLARAEAAKRRAQDELKGPRVVDMDFERARIALLKSLIRLQVAERAKTGR